MGTITKPMLLDETGQKILEAIKEQNQILGGISVGGSNSGSSDESVMSWADIQKAVQEGKASSMFKIGDQIIVPWNDYDSGCVYNLPFDVVHFGNVQLEDGSSVPGMYLQSHYAFPYFFSFDGTEGETVSSDNELESYFEEGYYYFTTSYPPTLLVNGEDYHVGDLIEEAVKRTPIPDESGGVLNSGYSLWGASAARQYFNSDASSGWFTPQHVGDNQIILVNLANIKYTSHGFLFGFDEQFRGVIKPVCVNTWLNGTLHTTYDKFFLPSLEQMNIEHEYPGEGDVFDYWKKATNTDELVGKEDGNEAYVPALPGNSALSFDLRLRSCSSFTENYAISCGQLPGSVVKFGANSYSSYLPVCVIC